MADDLFGERPDPPKKSKAASDGSVVRVETQFKETYAVKFGLPLQIKHGRDRKFLKEMIETWGEQSVSALVGRFFESHDPKVTNCYMPDYTIQHFSRVASYLQINGHGRRLDPITAHNADAVRRAVGARKK